MNRCLAMVLLTAVGVAARADEPETVNAKFQSTYIWQRKPAMGSPYAGPHSLLGEAEKSYSFTATAAFGLRLGTNTEVYFDPEVAQGVPLSGLLGLAGFSNGEMARTSGAHPTVYRARLFVRHVIGLGGETEDIDSAMNQLASKYASRRLTLTAGNLSVLDIFDANGLNHDPRTQFMNWTLMTHGAYDYAADARGYTWGVAAEYIADGWSIRAGRFIQPKQPNQLELDPKIGRHCGDQVEVEKRYDLGENRPGIVRVLAYRNRAVMARYDDALALAATTNSVPSLDAVRSTEHTKAGLGLNVEQQLSRNVGVFSRAMWADGKTETYAFTEADKSISAGVAIKGAAWARSNDSVGLAMAQNRLSSSHRAVLAAGGLTFFLGDGRLNYRAEQVLEAYYSWVPIKGIAVSLDYQRISNPGYNADRGPASFVAVRLHAEN